MIIGVPKEIKTREYRVGMTPAGVRQLVKRGHSVNVETGAGEGSGIKDEQYVQAGGLIVPRAKEAWAAAMVVEGKEPQQTEYRFLRDGLILYTDPPPPAAPSLPRAL